MPKPSPKILPRHFYERDPRRVARELLGKVFVRRLENGTILAGRLVETEAYLGQRDPAAHSFIGMTQRNAVLFGPSGHAYVYFTYGMHHCMNVSAHRRGGAGGVLFRALEPLAGLNEMAVARGMKNSPDELSPAELRRLASGPGRICQAMSIVRELHNGKDVTSPDSDLQIWEDFPAEPDSQLKYRIVATTRIGVSKAANLKLRYLIAGSPFVSVTVKT